METFDSISSRENKRAVLIQDGSELSKEAEWYLKENHIPYNVLYQETKYSHEYMEFINNLPDDDDDDEEEWFTDCILEQNTERGFEIILWHNLRNNKN